jgi:hypothetical protein
MKVSMYAMTHDVFKKALTQLLYIMEKGVANARPATSTPAFGECATRTDMLPFVKQIQLTGDFAKNSWRGSRAWSAEVRDNETTMDELVARVKKTLDYIATVPAAALEGSETRDIKIPLRDRTLEMKGLPFLQNWAIPNFFFHYVTAYNLLRHNGVDIGKRDFLGG